MLKKTSSSAITDLIIRICGEENRDLIQLNMNWKRIVGKIIAEKSYVHKYENDRILVAVQNSVWLNELMLKKTFLINEIKEKLHIEVKDMYFFIKAEKI